MNRILVAEDEARIARFVQKGLRAHGFVPTVVADGRTALQHAISDEFDLMVLDIGLPDLDGFQVLARLRDPGSRAADDAVLERDGLRMDVTARRVSVDGRDVDLSAREFALAEVFLRHAGQVLSREQLLSRVWGYDFDPGSNVVDVYVRYLRKKLGADRIQTVRGSGYRLP